jgi:DNA-binding LacI/PurR family transcriptional regulator
LLQAGGSDQATRTADMWYAPSMAKRGGTLSEVAERCSVSPSTASRVLNNRRQGRFSVSSELREKILKVAADLNYRPSVAARNLAAGRTNLVAVLGVQGIWSDRVGPVEEAIGALAGVLDAAGYEICLQFISSRHGWYDMPGLRVDGIVAVGPSNQSDLADLDASGVPYVSVNGLVGENGSQVVPDDTKGTRLALQHFVDLGHKRIAYLDHWSADAKHPSVFERRAAFAAAADEIGFTAPSLHLPMLPAETAWDLFYEPFVRRAIIEEGCTAVLAYSHYAALGLMRAAYDLKMTVPRDFSLACFNNEPIVRTSIPALTAIDVPSQRMGQIAAEMLLRKMKHAMGPSGDATNSSDAAVETARVKVEESLIVRESTAPPGGRR